MQIKNQQVLSVSWGLNVSNLQIASPPRAHYLTALALVAGDW